MLADRLGRCFTGRDGRPYTLQLPQSSLQIFSCKLIVVDSLAQCRQPSTSTRTKSAKAPVRGSTRTQALSPATSSKAKRRASFWVRNTPRIGPCVSFVSMSNFARQAVLTPYHFEITESVRAIGLVLPILLFQLLLRAA